MTKCSIGLATLSLVGTVALSPADEEHTVVPWPYGLYDKNIPRQDAGLTNAAMDRPLQVLYYSFDTNALETLNLSTNGMKRETPATPLETVTISGTVSNMVFGPTRIWAGVRGFEVKTDGVDSSYDVTNTPSFFRAAFKGRELSSFVDGPYTNASGIVSNVIAAKIEFREAPRDDGTWINYLWLAFGSHSYFTRRTNNEALPIWRTALHPRDEDERQMGIRAFYTPLSRSPFPQEVDYVTDRYHYFRGRTTGARQKVRLGPPLDQGYTNFAGRTLAYTNFGNLSVPVDFEIVRYGPERIAPKANTALRMLTYTRIKVESISVDSSKVEAPEIRQSVVVSDFRVDGNSGVRRIARRMTNGGWPDLESTLRQEKIVAEELKRIEER